MKNAIITAAIALLATFVGVKMFAPAGTAAAQSETALQRVLRTQTLRCAYTVAPTFIEKDANTGQLSGLGFDVTEAIAKALGIAVVWGPEVGPHEIFEGFKNNAFDANCSGYWRTPERAHGGDFTDPIFYTPAHIFVRKGEQRFKTLADLNKPEVTFVGMDGEATVPMLPVFFPQAKAQMLPGMAQFVDRFLAVTGGKADATIADLSMGQEFMAKNPGVLEQLPLPPLVTQASALILAHDEQGLKNFLDAGIASVREKGILQEIIRTHNVYPGGFLPPASQVGAL
ncbi:MAG: transporter substrate-binding domain-containing protein [Alphaproteobacteria bacterium]